MLKFVILACVCIAVLGQNPPGPPDGPPGGPPPPPGDEPGKHSASEHNRMTRQVQQIPGMGPMMDMAQTGGKLFGEAIQTGFRTAGGMVDEMQRAGQNIAGSFMPGGRRRRAAQGMPQTPGMPGMPKMPEMPMPPKMIV